MSAATAGVFGGGFGHFRRGDGRAQGRRPLRSQSGAHMNELVFPPPKRKRSRRLRKKLHIGEFQRLGFEYDLTWMAPLSPETQEALLEALIDDFIEPRGLCLGGGLTCGFIDARRASVTEEDRLAFQRWIHARPGLRTAQVGQLRDAWYDTAPEVDRYTSLKAKR